MDRMKHPIWMAMVSIITIVALVGAFYYFSPAPPSSHIPDSQLDVNSLMALTDGQVSFNVILHEGASAILEAVVLNDTRYLWSDGSHEDQTILKGETKQWSINIGSLKKGSNIQVVVEATPESGSSSGTVEAPPSDVNNPNDTDYVYDDYGGVGLFTEGIHILATDQDPRTMSGDFLITNNYWKMLREHATTRASDQDFISILLSRGDKPTGGYNIQIESFSWLESYPVKFLFQVNFTDPGENVMVTEALTNPLILVPIGKLTPGEYNIEVPITQYILNIDEEGNPYYTPILTFAPVIWEQTLMISRTDDPTASTTFEVIVNGNEAPDLTVQVDLSNGLTEEEAKKIAEAAFVRTMGEAVLSRLDTLTYDDEQLTAHYTWGVDEDDMGHVFDSNANLVDLQITITHCL
jgi:hypothetical protein